MFLHKNIIPGIFLRGKKAYSYLDIHFFQFNLHFYIKIIVFYINKMTLCAVMALVTWWVVKALVFLHSDGFFSSFESKSGQLVWIKSPTHRRAPPIKGHGNDSMATQRKTVKMVHSGILLLTLSQSPCRTQPTPSRCLEGKIPSLQYFCGRLL